MGYYTGSQGSIQFGRSDVVNTDPDPNQSAETGWSTTDAKISNWTLSTSSQLLDTTTLGVLDKTSVYGLRTTSGTLRLFYYSSQTPNSSPSFNSASYFIAALARDSDAPDMNSIRMHLRLYIDANNYSGQLALRDYIELDANLTSVSYGSNVGELVSVDISFEADGPIFSNRL